MALLELRFVGGANPELFETSSRLSNGAVCSAVRGKTSGAYRGYGTFQWTSAVKAVCVALLRAKLAEGQTVNATISGEKGSLAASLDYALSKEPNWLGEMFGYTSGGTLLARRLFLVSNPNRKRPGPVVIVLNERVLACKDIAITLDGNLLTCPAALASLLAAIASTESDPAGGLPAEFTMGTEVVYAKAVNG
ncbi:MAG: hypothetical protein EBZ48_03070 [Proteobacteria bacterium]|nr:hypothetical protein [Pseudomonadota bacterium]